MIKSIRLVNWRSHADTSLQFRQGTNLLVGMMGAGKSSVLEAISFAFFGTFPALERRKMKLENILRLDESTAKITLEFEWEGQGYRIERRLERSKRGIASGAELFRGGSEIDHGSTAVTAAVQRITGVDYDLFTRAIYSEQNNIDYFLNLDAGTRKHEIDTLLGLDRFEDARSSIVSVINRVAEQRRMLEERFSRVRMAELESKEKEHAAAAASARDKLAHATAASERKAKELTGSSAKFDEMRRHREAFERLDKEAIALAAQQESLKKELEGVVADEAFHAESKKRLAGLVGERNKLAEQARAVDSRSAVLSKEAGTLEARMKSASEAKSRLDSLRKELKSLLGAKTVDALQTRQKEAEKEVLAHESERRSLESSVAEIDELVHKLKPGLAECPLCSSKLDDAGISHIKHEKQALAEARKKRIKELLAAVAAGKKENEALLAGIKKAVLLSEQGIVLEKELKGAEGLPERKAELEAALGGIHSERDAIQKRSTALADAIEKLRVELSGMESAITKKKSLASLEVRLADALARLAAMKFDEKSFETLRSAVETLRLGAATAASEKQSLEAQSRMAADMLNLVRGELSGLKQMEKDAIALAKLGEELAIYRNAVLETQISLRASLIDAINTAMNEVWAIFYPYRNYSAIRLEVTEKDYLFEVNDGNAWKGLETTASGGERASAALTLRVALAMVLTPRLSWLILDEPTHNLDTEAIEMLSTALQTKVPQVVNQTFVITHEEGLMGSDFASSYRLSRDKEHNGDTKAEVI
ncbi:MAG: SMC family ATPase [Candidatus ainarchaeum sp.]|nr:SMC family ATPase [Candidatus ainarchaeum sp.]